MKSGVFIYFVLVFTIFLAGCIGGGQSNTDVVSTDMLVIKNIDVFPSKDVRPDDQIIMRMEVENKGQRDTYLLADTNSKSSNSGASADSSSAAPSDNTKPSFDGDYLLMDRCNTLYTLEGDMTILSRGNCIKNLPNDVPPIKKYDGTSYDPGKACYIKVSPGQSQTFQWKIKAPSEDAISKMANKCNFKFQAAYSAKAETNTEVYFANPVEVAERLYTQKDMSLAGNNIATFGPIAINFEPAEPQPISAATKDRPDNWTVYINIKNVGTGIADVTNLTVALPKSMEKANCRLFGEIEKEMNDKDCSNNKNDPDCVTLSKELDDLKSSLKIYFDKSSRIVCVLKSPENVAILTPFKFTTTADYTYRQNQEITIKTTPVREMS
ncbi:Uncharacterised protein [uncultured archaeon]|nr:Uncharacterised protein [uncultured archaeon]